MNKITKDAFLKTIKKANLNKNNNEITNYLKSKGRLQEFNYKIIENNTNEINSQEIENCNFLINEIKSLNFFEINYLFNLLNKEELKNIPKESNVKQKFLTEIYEYPDYFKELISNLSANTQVAPEIIEEEKEVVEEKKIFNIKLMSFEASKKLSIIKEIKTVLGLGLKESKELVDKAPTNLKEKVPTEDAKLLKEKFEKLGCKIELV